LLYYFFCLPLMAVSTDKAFLTPAKVP
jgi:hypothetical protein